LIASVVFSAEAGCHRSTVWA